jgi:hypothetical protein
MLPAPAQSGTPALLYYLGLGINAIPLGVGQKDPYRSVLGGQWKTFQTTRISTTQANAWVQLADPQHGVGLICGKISGGLVCLDADHDAFAAWLLDHRDHPLLVGTWVVETGSAKVHIWVRTHKPPQVHAWYLRQGLRAGEVRGEGSYAAAPPSIHPSGKRYESRQGSPENMLVVDDVDALARSLADAYLLTNPTDVPTPTNDKSYRVLDPNPEQIAEIGSRVLAAQFPRKIRDALLKPGCQDVNHAYWQACDSHSEIDFAVVCAMVRKGWSSDEAEWIFAGSLLAANCYANKQRHGSKGFAYWKTTWDAAQAAVNQQVAASRVATGANFKVIQAVRVGNYNPRFRLKLETMGNPGGERLMRVTVSTEELANEKGFQLACMRQAFWQPLFAAGQRGRDFQQFTGAVLTMVTDQVGVAREFTTTGWREAKLIRFLEMCADRVPAERGMVSMGWAEDGVFYVMGEELYAAIRAHDRSMTNEQFMDCVMSVAETREVVYRFPSGQAMRVLRLVPRPGRLSLALASPDADDDGN